MAAGRYRKRPVVVEALRIVDHYGVSNWHGVAAWCGGSVEYGPLDGTVTRYIAISTLEGVMVARVGDWVIRGVQGEHYPCKPDIFEQTYEPVHEDR